MKSRTFLVIFALPVWRCPFQEVETGLVHPNEADRGKMILPVFVESLLDAA